MASQLTEKDRGDQLATPTPNESPSDEELVRQAGAGDDYAFRHLVRRHEARVYALARSQLADVVAAQEVAQDAFVRLYRHLDRLRFDASLSTWLHRVTINLCRDQQRRWRRSNTVRLEEAAVHTSEANPEDDVVRQESSAEVREAIARLTPELREAVTLRYLGGLSYADIARAQNSPVGTVCSRIHRGLKQLAEELSPPPPAKELA